MSEGAASELRARILALVGEFAREEWPAPKEFVRGETPVPVSGRVFDGADVTSLVDASLDFWLTTGRFADEFERSFARFVGVPYALLVNSGSSANLLALTALTSPLLGERALKPGDEVITCATSFPTTVAPILQNGLVPVYLDVTLPTYNLDAARLEEALSPRTRAVMVAHTLGNPFDLDAVTAFTKEHGLLLVEDTCDALGARWKGRHVGTFGDAATVSFYPAHHITMGEGGAVLTGDAKVRRAAESFRDWGRDCWCAPGKANTCGKRFEWQLGDLPYGYDHKYIYSHLGYNLKATDMQAAVGCAQLGKLPSFIEKRRANFARLVELLEPLRDRLILPEATPGSEPSWFGVPLTLREGARERREVIDFLEGRKIATRLLFAGNILRQPAFKDTPHRAVGDLANADLVAERTFWVGCYPGITGPMLEWVAESLAEALS